MLLREHLFVPLPKEGGCLLRAMRDDDRDYGVVFINRLRAQGVIPVQADAGLRTERANERPLIERSLLHHILPLFIFELRHRVAERATS